MIRIWSKEGEVCVILTDINDYQEFLDFDPDFLSEDEDSVLCEFYFEGDHVDEDGIYDIEDTEVKEQTVLEYMTELRDYIREVIAESESYDHGDDE